MPTTWFDRAPFGTRPDATFGSILSVMKGVGPGFDLIRFGLAFAILYGHCGAVSGKGFAPDPATFDVLAYIYSGGGEAWQGWKRAPHAALLPMFFALSGFLVAGSAFRLRSPAKFFAFRALRIVPALTVEVTLSALVLGPIFTSHTLAAYFTDPKFFAYFGNIFGVITFELPGVFVDNPLPRIVNLNLWTLPPEFYCYLVLIALMITGLLYQRAFFTAVLAAFTLPLLVANAFFSFGVRAGPLPGHVIIYYFFVGCLFFHWKERIPYNWALFAVSLIGSYVTLSFHTTYYVAPVFVTYAVVFVGLTPPPRNFLIDKVLAVIKSGDYSYGLYLYGFPISQALIASVPALRAQHLPLFFSTLAITATFAVVSWICIEKPALSLKSKISASKSKVTETLLSERSEA